MKIDAKFQRITFDEEFLTIPDAIKRIGKKFDLSLNNKDSKAYKTIYKRLERELKAMNLDGTEHMRKDSKRKTKYSRRVLEAVVNDSLYSWLAKQVESAQKEDFERWKKLKEAHGQVFADHIGVDEEIANSIEDEVQKRKIDIAIDFLVEYVLHECIEVDEKLLREDVVWSAERDEMNPGAYDHVVDERLNDPKNYYTVKKRPTTFKAN
ncbi:MAG: hypothetical protein HDT15_11570 [Oscillibacter sp.]|nr:hypothetical protein [Oscillibacter sp.]